MLARPQSAKVAAVIREPQFAIPAGKRLIVLAAAVRFDENNARRYAPRECEVYLVDTHYLLPGKKTTPCLFEEPPSAKGTDVYRGLKYELRLENPGCIPSNTCYLQAYELSCIGDSIVNTGKACYVDICAVPTAKGFDVSLANRTHAGDRASRIGWFNFTETAINVGALYSLSVVPQ